MSLWHKNIRKKGPACKFLKLSFKLWPCCVECVHFALIMWLCSINKLCKCNMTRAGRTGFAYGVSAVLSHHMVVVSVRRSLHKQMTAVLKLCSLRLNWGHLLPLNKHYESCVCGLTRERKTQSATDCHSGSPPCWSWRGWAPQHHHWLSRRLGQRGAGSSPALLQEERIQKVNSQHCKYTQ